MALRVVNDDPCCRSQQRCRVANWLQKRGICNICHREAKMERAVLSLKPETRRVPDEFDELYRILKVKVGAKEAQRLIEEERVIRARREQAQRKITSGDSPNGRAELVP